MSDYELDVQWGDQDAYQHVNNCRFAFYSEQARIAFLYGKTAVAAGPVRAVLASLKIDFKRPVFFPDHLTIKTSVSKIGNTSMTFVQTMTSRSQQAVVCETTNVLVFVEFPAMVPVAVPESFKAL